MPDGMTPSNDGKGLKVVGQRVARPDGLDKVTGRARFGADFNMPGMIHGVVLRSPHAHARIKKIDTSKAKALKGVKAIVTRDDFQDLPSEFVAAGEQQVNYKDMTRCVMAREKALFEGHPVAAVAATTVEIAKQAIKLIEVDYEVLPHVIDPVAAMADDAPVLHEDMTTIGVPDSKVGTNVAKRVEFAIGDVDAGFKDADLIIEREFNTQPVHQGYIEPHACLASVSEDGNTELWCTTQGHFIVRAHVAKLCGISRSKIRVTASEIGGGFGGKTVVYLEPLAVMLSKKAGHPVKMVMSREDVQRGTGPTSGANVWVKLGAKKDGTLVAGEAVLKYQAGAFQGSPVQPGCMCAFAPYAMEHVKVTGFDVVSNRPKVAAYRAPGGPISEYAVESVVDEIARELKIDPIDLRLKNASKEGTQMVYGPKLGPVGLVETLEAAKKHPHYNTPLKPGQGRGVASGFWFNIGGETCANITLAEDGTVTITAGTPDIGGSRVTLAQQAAETLGVEYDVVKAVIADTSSLGFTFLTGGSRVTFSSGMAVIEAVKDAIEQLRERAAKTWDIPVDAVVWENGMARPVSSNAGEFEPLTLADLAKNMGKTGGPIVGKAAINAQGAGPSFATHICDVEVDKDTGRVEVVRYTAIQDAGRAIHPSFVEGQMQGGAVQGIGWALNEEYIYDDKGRLMNAGFLDYRVPVCSDMPMIDTEIVEVPNPRHPYGVRGIGETPIVPPMGTVANAVADALGIRFEELPMSPPRVLKALEENTPKMAAE